MGLRQSKRSVDITASPKKDAAVEKTPDDGTIEKIEEEQIKTQAPVNGDTKSTETAEIVCLNAFIL